MIIKKLVKIIYIYVTIIINKMKNFIFRFRHSKMNRIEISEKNNDVFFGYYDISPFSQNSKYCLVNKVINNEKMMEVGYYQMQEKNIAIIGETETWCWQQGCRLQWLNAKKNEMVIYNKIVNNKLGCVIQSILTKKVINRIESPIYTITSDGRWGLSLNFLRLGRLRKGYGYDNFPDETVNERISKNDKVRLINLNTGTIQSIFSMVDICNIDYKNSMDNSTHYFNHLCFSPSGEKFLFFHIWQDKKSKYIRMLTSDKLGKNIKVILNTDYISHYTWCDDENILAFCKNNNDVVGYFFINANTGNFNHIGKGLLKKDGHPSVYRNVMLSDENCYRTRHKLLYKYYFKDSKQCNIEYFYYPKTYQGENRCDLHPRINFDGSLVCIDAIKRRKRVMVVYKNIL